jgi:hypothetical protein
MEAFLMIPTYVVHFYEVVDDWIRMEHCGGSLIIGASSMARPDANGPWAFDSVHF